MNGGLRDYLLARSGRLKSRASALGASCSRTECSSFAAERQRTETRCESRCIDIATRAVHMYRLSRKREVRGWGSETGPPTEELRFLTAGIGERKGFTMRCLFLLLLGAGASACDSESRQSIERNIDESAEAARDSVERRSAELVADTRERVEKLEANIGSMEAEIEAQGQKASAKARESAQQLRREVDSVKARIAQAAQRASQDGETAISDASAEIYKALAGVERNYNTMLERMKTD